MARPDRPYRKSPYVLEFEDGSKKDMPASKYSTDCESLEKIIHLGVYEYLLNIIRVGRMRNLTDYQITIDINKLFRVYLGENITERHLESWLMSDYPELKKAYFFNMDAAVGHLYEVAINIAEKADAKSGGYVIDLINKIESNNKKTNSSEDGEADNVSKQTSSTVARIFNEAKRFIK
jgi:hypothetical protein